MVGFKFDVPFEDEANKGFVSNGLPCVLLCSWSLYVKPLERVEGFIWNVLPVVHANCCVVSRLPLISFSSTGYLCYSMT